ncbi:ribonuclease Y isoform X3 [Hydra vulgaris]|uniref:Ribonuclease Y isoform X3 n=1 Tax=Hydra vulgaris TaxID=6087 RepID=A0ABM4BCW7_HYDVU
MQKNEFTFEEMKKEFILMDEEIKEKNLKIVELKNELAQKVKALDEKEEAVVKMIEQTEELHENLAELDARFERSEKMNLQLKEEKEEAREAVEKELQELKRIAKTSEDALNDLRNNFKQFIERAVEPVTNYLQKNKGSKIPIKKTKGYRLLKTIEIDLQKILNDVTSNAV